MMLLSAAFFLSGSCSLSAFSCCRSSCSCLTSLFPSAGGEKTQATLRGLKLSPSLLIRSSCNDLKIRKYSIASLIEAVAKIALYRLPFVTISCFESIDSTIDFLLT